MNPIELLKDDWSIRESKINTWVNKLNFTLADVLSYYSTWSMIFCLVPYENKMIDLMKLNMLLHCSFGGFYFSYISPRKIHIEYLDLILDGFLLKIMDFLAHQLILFIFLFKKGIIYPENLIDYTFMNLPIIIYLYNFDIYHKYGIHMKDLQNMLPFYLLFFFYNI